jgi:hypothetical protein
MTNLLRSLIRETLLLEEVYGAQAVVYHGTKADPLTLIDALLKDKFIAGAGAGAMYGKGLYTVYDLAGTQTEKGAYGPHVIKLKVNLYGYIIFDPDIALKVYKRPLTPAQQAEEVGYSDEVVKVLRGVRKRKDGFTSEAALKVHLSLQYETKGLVFTGRNDGRVVVVYDPTTAVPMAWKRVGSKSWTPVDRSALLAPLERPDVSAREGRPVRQSALARSALGDFDAGKWSPVREVLKMLGRLESLPEDQRVVDGDLDLRGTQITSLPVGLKVGGTLDLRDTPITTLPAGLKVGGHLDLRGTPIADLPTGLKVGGVLHLKGTKISALPVDLKVDGGLILSFTPIASLPSGLKVSSDLDVSNTPISSLPAGLQVDGGLYLAHTQITSLPADLKVGGTLDLRDTPITTLPAGLKVSRDLDLRGTPITSLPAGLKVGRDLHLFRTSISSLPADLQVGGAIFSFDWKYRDSVPEHLRSKLY